MYFRLLHLHPCFYLFLFCRVAARRSLEADFFWRINKEDFINEGIESAFEKDGALKGNHLLRLLLLRPKSEVFQDGRMDNGIDSTCILRVGKEVIGKPSLVESLSVKDLRANKFNEFLANLLAFDGQPFSLLVAVIYGNAELSL